MCERESDDSATHQLQNHFFLFLERRSDADNLRNAVTSETHAHYIRTRTQKLYDSGEMSRSPPRSLTHTASVPHPSLGMSTP